MSSTPSSRYSANLRHSSRDFIPQRAVKLGQLRRDLTNLSKNALIRGESSQNLKVYEHSLKHSWNPLQFRLSEHHVPKFIELGHLCRDLINLSRNLLIRGESFQNSEMHENSIKHC